MFSKSKGGAFNVVNKGAFILIVFKSGGALNTFNRGGANKLLELFILLPYTNYYYAYY